MEKKVERVFVYRKHTAASINWVSYITPYSMKKSSSLIFRTNPCGDHEKKEYGKGSACCLCSREYTHACDIHEDNMM